MSIKTDCTACSDLQKNAPNVIVNGIGDSACTNLKNNEGLNGKSNDCDDLNDLNDCLVGNMDAELEAYDICDWKDFMHKFIPNVFTVLKGIICAICGIWDNIDKIWCWLNHLTEPATATLYPTEENGFYMADGVKQRTGGKHDTPLQISFIGNVAHITGSLEFDGNMPARYHNGNDLHSGGLKWVDFHQGMAHEVKTHGGMFSHEGNTPDGNFLVYEYVIPVCKFGFRSFFTTELTCPNAGDLQFGVFMFRPTADSGEQIPHDYGWDAGSTDDGVNWDPTNWRGRNCVPDGYKASDMRLLQVRLINARTWGTAHSNGKITPLGNTGIRQCTSTFDCD